MAPTTISYNNEIGIPEIRLVTGQREAREGVRLFDREVLLAKVELALLPYRDEPPLE